MNCSCDYEYSTVWSERKVRARKEHKCSECNGLIRKRETYTKIGSLFDGRWDTYRHCEDCKVTICDLGRATKESGGCFCYTATDLMGDMQNLAHHCNPDELKILHPIFAAFNAASKSRGGSTLRMDIFKVGEGAV